MRIERTLLQNFRTYYGRNEVRFPTAKEAGDKNVVIIAGRNGFGKTSFLNAMLWCLYGKLLVHVDEHFRKEIYESGGYPAYAASNLNRLAKQEGAPTYQVEMIFGEVYIPSLPCKEVTISRRFFGETSTEELSILIDGAENELTKQVGPEIFVQDFILPKEVAKFFFFDAERIVTMAEARSNVEKRQLSRAYAEVLGIHKYETLRAHLTDARVRFRKTSGNERDPAKYAGLKERSDQLTQQIQSLEKKSRTLDEEKEVLKRQSDSFQERLIREGNSMTLDQLLELKRRRDELAMKAAEIKERYKEYYELLPFAIAWNRMTEVKEQLEYEAQISEDRLNAELLQQKAAQLNESLSVVMQQLSLHDSHRRILSETVSHVLKVDETPPKQNGRPVLLDFSKSEHQEFMALYAHIRDSFSVSYRKLNDEAKSNRLELQQVQRLIADAEVRENDPLVQEIRRKKEEIDERHRQLDQELREIYVQLGGLQQELSSVSRVLSEAEKHILLDDQHRRMDEVSKGLIDELDLFILSLKREKKTVLEKKLKNELQLLMHKSLFVQEVSVEIENDMIDIRLFDTKGEELPKERLSKGEQQLYASALLKCLVDESEIKFPIFVDSPLQKLDHAHAANVLTNFYPKISEQVVLLPLLEKELSSKEFTSLAPSVATTYLLAQEGADRTKFEEVFPTSLFLKEKEYSDVHTY